MKYKYLLHIAIFLSISSHSINAENIRTINCESNKPGTILIEDEQLYLVVDDHMIRHPDYWQNFLAGNIQLCTSQVTDMSKLFSNNEVFNQDISNWDTTNVINMNDMFNGTKRFDQDLTQWNVEQVRTHQNFSTNSALSFEKAPRFNH